MAKARKLGEKKIKKRESLVREASTVLRTPNEYISFELRFQLRFFPFTLVAASLFNPCSLGFYRSKASQPREKFHRITESQRASAHSIHSFRTERCARNGGSINFSL